MTLMRDAAMEYATRGWPVFPIKPRSKEPLTEHGFLDASTDPAQVEAWWTRWPEANIGAACGHAFDVLDQDGGNEGVIGLLDLLEEHGLPRRGPREWLRVATGGDGRHYYFQPGGPVRWARFRPHLDWLGLRGYVILPPSVHPSGGRYRWIENTYVTDKIPDRFPPAPAWLHKAATRPVREARPVRDPGGDPEGRPGDDFNRRMGWAELLEADGARLERRQGDVDYWTRPGKARGISASVGGGGHDLLYVFSGNWPKLEADTSYSKFAYWAATRHGGDFAQAAKDLAARGYGDQAEGPRRDYDPPEDGWTWPAEEPHREVSERSEQRSPAPDLISPSSLSSHWPVLDPAALHGIAGKVVTTLAPHTEADPAALLLTFLAAAGNLVGLGPHAIADAAPHPARLNVVLVGQTSRARKGTAWAQIRRLLAEVDPSWTTGCVLPGIASGEALIAEVRDGTSEEDLGVADIRRLVLEPEFARLLAVAGREGSILSAVLREAWDGNVLKNRTKSFPQTSTGAHISVVGHVTREELLRRLTDTEAANGFANRFLFAMVRRSKRLPEGGSLDPATLDDLAAQVGHAIERAYRVGALRRDADARELWAKAYEDFGDGSEGLAGAITARPEAQTLRLSVAYAALDGSPVITVAHLQAALAVWSYCEASALAIFGDALGDPVADRLLTALRDAGEEGLDGTAQSALFGRHASATRLAQARSLLEGKGLIVTETEETGGRPRLVSRAVMRG